METLETDKEKWGRLESHIRLYSNTTIKYDPTPRLTCEVEVDQVMEALDQLRSAYPDKVMPAKAYKEAAEKWRVEWLGRLSNAT